MDEFNKIIEGELAHGANLSIINLMDHLIQYASDVHASDIHIDPQEHGVRIRFRIDGVLEDCKPLPKAIHGEIISRIKVLSSLRTDEHAARPGRPLPQHHRRQDVRRRARVHRADVSWRERRAPAPRRQTPRTSPSRPSASPKSTAEDPLRHQAPLRHDPRHRPDRLRQDHYPLHPHQDAQFERDIHRHYRGPDRVRRGRHRADPGEPAHGPLVRETACARSFARTRTSSWSARSATWRRPASP
ncbi:MAG: ATPase, T2SS/T4P/T4SS family [bacterium]